MSKKHYHFLVALLVIIALLITAIKVFQSGKRVGGEMSYTVIDSTDISSILTSEVQIWYENNYSLEGIHTFDFEKTTYILVCAGEKPTGGYSVENVVLLQGKDEIQVIDVIKCPADNQFVTDAITYPHKLLSIPKESKRIILGHFDKELMPGYSD